jgi:nucleoside-diphosphate-sugar epimerase
MTMATTPINEGTTTVDDQRSGRHHARPSTSVVILGVGDPVGHRVARALIASAHPVTVAGFDAAVLKPFGKSCPVIHLDDFDALRTAVASHDAVVNLEPVIGEPHSTLGAVRDRRVRRHRARQLTALTDAFAGAAATRWVQRSTPALYRHGDSRWLREHWPTAVNAATQHAQSAEHAVNEHRHRGGEGVVLRLARPYGPDDIWTQQLIRLARNGWQPFDGPDSAFVPTIALADATSAVLAALDMPAGTYNVADPTPTTNRDLNEVAARIVGRQRLHDFHRSLTRAHQDLAQRSHRLDVSAFTNATGWNPRFDPTVLAFVPSTKPLTRLEPAR